MNYLAYIMSTSLESSESEQESVEETHPTQQVPQIVETSKHEQEFMRKMEEKDAEFKTLRKELRLLRKRYPDVKLFQTTKEDEEINGLSIEQLKEVIDNFKEDIGVAEPCAMGQLVVTMIGKSVEVLFGEEKRGFAAHLAKNTQLVTWADGLPPTFLMSYGDKFKAIQALVSEFLSYENKSHVATSS